MPKYVEAFDLHAPPVVYVFDPWEGLLEAYTAHSPTKTFTAYRHTDMKGEPDPFAPPNSELRQIGLRQALTYMDAHLKNMTQHTVLIVKNIEAEAPELTQALRSWTTHSAIFKGKSSIFLFVTDAHNLLDDHLFHMSTVIDIPSSTYSEREAVANQTRAQLRVKNNAYHKPYDKVIIDLSAGLNIHDFTSALLESHITQGFFMPDDIRKHKIAIVEKTGVLRFIEPKFGFEAVGGYESTKEFIKNDIIAILNRPDLAERIGLKPPRGVLFFGPPGTGKSLLGEAVTYMLGLPMVELNLSDVLNKYVGESETKLRHVIKLIEEISPIVVWMDERKQRHILLPVKSTPWDKGTAVNLTAASGVSFSVPCYVGWVTKTGRQSSSRQPMILRTSMRQC